MPSPDELALQTQLLLQQVTQVTQQHGDTEDAEEADALSYETARNSLVAKLRQRKETMRTQQKQLQMRRFGLAGASNKQNAGNSANQMTENKTNKSIPHAMKTLNVSKLYRKARIPVAVPTANVSIKKKQLLADLKRQAIHQGSQEMAKLFGYSSYEEQLKHLNKIEKIKLLQNEMKEKEEQAKAEAASNQQVIEFEEGDEDGEDAEALDPKDEQPIQKPTNDGTSENKANEVQQDAILHQEEPQASSGETNENAGASSPRASSSQVATHAAAMTTVDNISASSTDQAAKPPDKEEEETAAGYEASDDEDEVETASPRQIARKKQRRREVNSDDEEPPAPAAAPEHGHNDGGDHADDETAPLIEQAAEPEESANSQSKEPTRQADADSDAAKQQQQKDKAAAFRELIRAEAMYNKKRKRLIKTGDLVESEAEEDEEEDVLKIGGLGDFGFGVPQAKDNESKEAEEERNALNLREDDLEGIVDELSDDEKQQQEDLDEIFRKDLEEQDREQVREVMRNVKEGFGRNRRAFSAGLHTGEARGRFNLHELVAADGSKLEAARLGLLESDEELSDDEEGKKNKKTNKGDEEEEEDAKEQEEEDEEAEMERVLRERYLHQPKIYITSSESESEPEDQDPTNKQQGDADNQVESDEEREKQQIKLFSERARINRRMHRMQQMQRDIAMASGDQGLQGKKPNPTLPSLLLDDDEEDSQELAKLLNRAKGPYSEPLLPSHTMENLSTEPKKTHSPHQQPTRARLARFNSYSITGNSRSSFNRVVDNCKMFSAGSTTTKAFVFTSADSNSSRDDHHNKEEDNDLPLASTSVELEKSKSWTSGERANKRQLSSGPLANSHSKRARPQSSASQSQPSSQSQKQPSSFFAMLNSYQVQ